MPRIPTYPTLDVATAYHLWAPTYRAEPHNPVMAAEQAGMEALLAQGVRGSALDIGTGTGRYVPLLRRHGARMVVGIDRSMSMLAHHAISTPLLCADALSLPFPAECFDVAIASLVVGHLQNLAAFLAEARRVLRPGGHLLYSDIHPAWESAGAQRTFTTAAGRTYAVVHRWRSIDEHVSTSAQAGFAGVEIREAYVAERSPAIDAWRARWGDRPVVVALRLKG